MAAAAGLPQLFLTADETDWPREWYSCRGFTELGHTYSFLNRRRQGTNRAHCYEHS
ncbi:hypothetical protein OG217_37105 (plasmid) [Streptomyces sp. NBC_01023]|uniref:hypothetical protein n=1 Tax=unclassified Streptomyces TaxID=2593676 RepID=UPI002F914D0B|nr:hypothetical protein OG217_37105 [Streptomyces sp. NBC_01023]